MVTDHLNASGIGHWEVIAKTGELFWSDVVYHLHGLEPGTLINIDAAIDAYHPDDREKVVEYVRCALEEKQDYQFTLRLMRADGEIRSVLSTGIVRLDSEDQVKSVFGIFEDITERLMSEEALKRSEENFRKVIEHAGDAMFVIDPKTARIRDVNIQACSILGYTRTELLNMTIPEIDIGTSEEALSAHMQGLRIGKVETLESVHRHKDGTPIPVEIRTGLIELQNELQLLAFARDISERKLADEKIRESEARFKSFFNNAPTIMSLKDTNSRYQMVNQSWQDFHKISSTRAAGKTAKEVLQKNLNYTPSDHEKEVLDSLAPSSKTRVVATENGPRTSVILKFPVLDAYGEVNGIGSIVTDITEQEDAQLQAKRMMMALNALEDSVLLLDNKDRVVTSNQAWRDQNYRVSDHTKPGTKFSDHLRAGLELGLYPEGIGREKAWLDQRMEHHKQLKYPLEISKQGGYWIRSHGHKLPDGGTVVIFSDITELKAREAAHIESERQFREVLENSPIGIAIVSKTTDRNAISAKRLFVNKAMVDLTGADSADQMLDAKLTDGWAIPAQRHAAAQIVHEGDDLIDFETLRQRVDGTEWLALMYSRPIHFNGTECIMIWHLDITKRKHAESALLRAHNELEQKVMARTAELETAMNVAKAANDLKSQLITTMNHELRTPLTSIIGSLRLIVDGAIEQIPETTAGILKIAWRNSERLAILVNDILDVERLENVSSKLKMSPIDLCELVRTSIELNDGLAKEYDVVFALLNDLPSVIVNGDETRLLQVMANLHSNAAKFSPNGGVVRTQISIENNQARVSVSDTGPGIEDKIKDNLFQKFVRGNNNDNRNTGGVGLGLNITKTIVEQHEGAIGFDAELAVGSTFYFTLPIPIDPHI